jgi:hypothetical protein
MRPPVLEAPQLNRHRGRSVDSVVGWTFGCLATSLLFPVFDLLVDWRGMGIGSGAVPFGSDSFGAGWSAGCMFVRDRATVALSCLALATVVGIVSV